jgi:hypothetical protein
MRRVLPLAFAIVAGSASAGSYTPPGVTGSVSFRCTDYATSTFDARFTGASCAISGATGRTVRNGSALHCVVDGSEPETLSISHRDTFSLVNRSTGGVLDGACRRI